MAVTYLLKVEKALDGRSRPKRPTVHHPSSGRLRSLARQARAPTVEQDCVCIELQLRCIVGVQGPRTELRLCSETQDLSKHGTVCDIRLRARPDSEHLGTERAGGNLMAQPEHRISSLFVEAWHGTDLETDLTLDGLSEEAIERALTPL